MKGLMSRIPNHWAFILGDPKDHTLCLYELFLLKPIYTQPLSSDDTKKQERQLVTE